MEFSFTQGQFKEGQSLLNRRNFLKLLGVSPIALFAKPKFGPSKQDKSLAKLTEISDYGTCSGPFIQFKGVWYFSDRNIIRWCSAKDLENYTKCWDGWNSIYLECIDVFDFWQHDKDKLYWGGKHVRFEVDAKPVGFDITIRYAGNFDEA